MTRQNVHFIWNEPHAVSRFKAAVSLHRHTDRSNGSLGCDPKHVESNLLGLATARVPPPADAYRAEAAQIEALGLDSMVSITDHDTIDGPNQLRCFLPAGKVPLSLEWTVPFGQGCFHVGVHNLPADIANEIVFRLLEVPCSQCQTSGVKCGGIHDPRCLAHVSDWMERLASLPETLLVLNHPLWNTGHFSPQAHRDLLASFLTRYQTCLHALELNGLRAWRENAEVMDLAEVWNLPVISGGDRHGCEPSTVVNLTATTDFSSFAREIRSGDPSVILFLGQSQQPLSFRKPRATLSATLANEPVVRPQTA